MKFSPVIHRYILKELIPPFALNMLFFMFVFLLTEILDITNMIVNYKISLVKILWLLTFSMPYFLVYVIPMSVMMAVLLTFLRLSSDNEIIALKSGGINIYQLLPPVFIFCAAGAVLTGFMIIYGLPWGRTAVKTMTVEIARSSIDIGLKERTFNSSFRGVMLYVNRIDLKNSELIDVFIQDERNRDAAVTVIAPKGRLYSDSENLVYRLRLFNGSINYANLEKRSVNTAAFDTYDLTLDLSHAASKIGLGPKGEKEMTLKELRAFIRDAKEKNGRYYGALIEFHKKFSIPFACIALGLLAVPLGIQSRAARKSFGLGLGLVLFLLYYLLLSAGVVFGEAGAYPPVIGMWVPNAVTLSIGLFLLSRTVQGRSVFIDLLPYFFKWMRKHDSAI